MIFGILADLVVVAHFAFIVFVVAGGVFALRWPKFKWIHLPAALWGLLIELAAWICPLTPLENWLRQKAGAEGYSEGFIAHYLLPIIYPAGLSRTVQFLLAGIVFVSNAVIYFWVWKLEKSSRSPRLLKPR